MKKIIMITLLLALTSHAEILRDTLSDSTTNHYLSPVAISNMSQIEYLIMVNDTTEDNLGSDSVNLIFGLQVLSFAKNPLNEIDTLLGNHIVIDTMQTSEYGTPSNISAEDLDGLFLLSNIDTLGVTDYAVRRALLSGNILPGQIVRPYVRSLGTTMKKGCYVKIEILVKASK